MKGSDGGKEGNTKQSEKFKRNNDGRRPKLKKEEEMTEIKMKETIWKKQRLKETQEERSRKKGIKK